MGDVLGFAQARAQADDVSSGDGGSIRRADTGEQERTGNIRDASNKVARKGKEGYRLNRKNIKGYEKIKGEPEAIDEEDANREALAAELAASKAQVTEVLLGKEADRLINGTPGRKPSADVVAITKQGQYLVFEAKGTDIPRGLEQLEHTSQVLGRSRVARQTLVVPDTIKTPGYSVRSDGQLLLHRKPAMVDGKPVFVVFTKQS